MDMSGTDNFQQEKRSEDLRNYHSTNWSSDWRIGSSNLANSSMGSIPTSNLTQGELHYCKMIEAYLTRELLLLGVAADVAWEPCDSPGVESSYPNHPQIRHSYYILSVADQLLCLSYF
ncbi:hypothetical protein CsSME_00022087 [Camellia sinensis var. sinensis]